MAVEAAKTTSDLAFIINKMVKTARVSVERTPELLPKLKEAGVVDAGGLGFLYFLEGMLYLVRGLTIDDAPIVDEKSLANMSGETSDHQLPRILLMRILHLLEKESQSCPSISHPN